MPTHGNDLMKKSNISYLNKDFSSLKSALIKYAKSYFPNSYRDFNETSPGMMLIEMSAYVGDVLNFYIDQSYREMLLPLAQEKRNVVQLARTLGYKVPASTPAYATITCTQLIDSNKTDINNIKPDFAKSMVIDKGMQIISTGDSSVKFETLEVLDFTISGTIQPEPYSYDSNGLIDQYKLVRSVNALSGETKSEAFVVNEPTQFYTITLAENNVIEIISIYDSNGNRWYEVDYLAQDKIPVDTHYTDDWVGNGSENSISSRLSAYSTEYVAGYLSMEVAAPYTLDYNIVSKRFITQVAEDNSTSLVFGNGLLRTGTTGSLQDGFYETQQAGITIPGEPAQSTYLSPVLGNSWSSLGEIPSNTTLTVTYRVGGGINTNVPSTDLNTYSREIVLNSNNTGNAINASGQSLNVINNEPARGGSTGMGIEEIKRNAMAFFTTQNRCVTREDYEARTLSLPGKYGNIAKVYVNRSDIGAIEGYTQQVGELPLNEYIANLLEGIQNLQTDVSGGGVTLATEADLTQYLPDLNNSGTITAEDLLPISSGAVAQRLGTVQLYTLSYNTSKYLTQPSSIIKNNLKKYLEQFRIMTDEVNITGGWVVNFGIVFDITAHKGTNKQELKLRCIKLLKDFFNTTKLQFKQPIYTSDLEALIYSLEGIRNINLIQLTQGGVNTDFPVQFPNRLSSLSGNPTDIVVDNPRGYGWNYDFAQFYNVSNPSGYGIILPTSDPSVFELKHPDTNIKGVVR